MSPIKKSNKFLKLLRANVYVFSDVFKHHKKMFFYTIIFNVLVAFAPFLQRGSEALLINNISKNFGTLAFSNGIIWLALLVPAVLLFNSIISIFSEYIDTISWREMRTRYEYEFYKKMGELDIAVHEDPKFRDKVQLLREFGSSFTMANFYGKIVRNISNIVGFIAAAIIMVNTDWHILLVIVIAIIPRFIVELKFGEQMWHVYQDKAESKRVMWHAQEQLDNANNIREAQTYKLKNFFLVTIQKILNTFHIEQNKKDSKAVYWKVFTQIFSVGALGYVVWILIDPVLAGQMQIGTFVFVLASALALQYSTIGFFLSISGQYQDAEFVNTYMEAMSQKSLINTSKFSKSIKYNKAPEIIFENVSFAYPSDPDKFILKDFNLKIAPGERLAIVGINGAGKSTFIKLLCRFYDVTSGRILINGIDLREIKLDDWYDAVALLSQDYQTYKFKVKDLIHLGKQNSKFDEKVIKESAIQSDADEFIQKWEHSYEQQIGVEFTGGIDPSQGQKQKLALARALFRGAFITILDEPTASVDAKAEKQIFDQLEKVMGSDKTLVLISHRFATVRNADKIAVIDGQNIKEIGTHEELLKIGGLYAEMYNAQAEGYKD